MGGLAALAWLAAALTGNIIVLRLAYVLTATVLAAALITWHSVRGVHIERRTVSDRSQVGSWAEEWLRVTNRSWLPKLWLEVRETGDLPGHQVSRVVGGLLPGRATSWLARTRCRRRGIFRLGPLIIAGGDPLGLFRLERPIPGSISFTVYPATVPLPGFDVPTGYLAGGEIVRRRAEFATTNIRGVRLYQPGDAFNRIHWPTTARRARLYAKEFELDPVADYWLLLDLQRDVHRSAQDNSTENEEEAILSWLGSGQPVIEPSTEEYAVTVAASIARRAIEAGRSIGLIAHGQRRLVFAPDRGERHLARILECLALVRAVADLRLDQVLSAESHAFTRHATLIVITPTTDCDWVPGLRALQLRGVQSMVVLIAAASFGDAPGNEPLRRALAAHRIPTYSVERDQLDVKAASYVSELVPSTVSPWRRRAALRHAAARPWYHRTVADA